MTQAVESARTHDAEIADRHSVLWDIRLLTKCYPAVTANDNISLKLRSHEVHGLLGANGCGKSTLIGMLSGTVRPTSGSILRNGTAQDLASARAAKQAGIATVFQEFSLAPNLSVAENIYLGQPLPKTRLGLVSFAKMRKRAFEVLDRLQIADQFSIDCATGQLSVAHQQLVEIAKAVAIGGDTLILDEPTAALSFSEIENLHQLLRRLKSEGQAILYVSHRLDEVIDIVDCATILKDGQVVSSAAETRLTIDYFVSSMVGKSLTLQDSRPSLIGNDIALDVRSLSAGGVTDIKFNVREGEILGIAGVMGSGRTSLLRSVFGADPVHSGTIRFNGEVYQPRSPRDSIKKGIAFVPENRKTDSLFFNFCSTRNVTISALHKVSRMSWISRSEELLCFSEYQQSMKLPDSSLIVGPSQLSGGNQQKLVLARWLFARSKLFLLDEPTNGVDVGAKASIYRLIRKIIEEGRSVILVTSDLKELLHLSDRIAILKSGRITDILPAASLDEESLTQAIATRTIGNE